MQATRQEKAKTKVLGPVNGANPKTNESKRARDNNNRRPVKGRKLNLGLNESMNFKCRQPSRQVLR
jgi:hypothetical protein